MPTYRNANGSSVTVHRVELSDTHARARYANFIIRMLLLSRLDSLPF